MKILNTLALILFGLLSQINFANAQAPLAIPYQAAARNAQGQVLANQNIRVRFTLTDSIAAGTVLYRETHQTTTSALGIFNLNLGTGTIVSGNMANIVWSKNSKFLKVELDATGTGNSYIDLGTQQLLSVPYAQYAAKAGNGFSHYIGEYFGGGVIFHLWKDSLGVEHGLVVDKTDLSTGSNWSNITTTLVGISAQSSWDGLSNSNAIVAQVGHTNSAAALCLNSTNGGQSDWYLPSIDELLILWNNRFIVNKRLATISGSSTMPPLANYWSSTEGWGDVSWYMGFYVNAATNRQLQSKSTNASFYVRAIRSF
jgi:hypothetical protein